MRIAVQRDLTVANLGTLVSITQNGERSLQTFGALVSGMALGRGLPRGVARVRRD